MKGSYRLKRILEGLGTLLFSKRYSRYFSPLGEHLTITGPCFIYGEGRLSIGDNCRIASFGFRRVELAALKDAELTIGNNVFINQGCRIISRKQIVVGDNCAIAPDVLILDSDFHETSSSDTDPDPVIIGNGVWISTRAMIFKGVVIGDGAVVAAGAVVTHSVPAQSMVGGVPARVIRLLPGSR